MIIVYLSIALVVGSLIYLAFYAVKTFKDTKPVMNRITKTTAMIQAKTEQLKSETDKLTVTQQEFTSDVQYKKDAVKGTFETVKQTPKPFKEIWQAVKGRKHSQIKRRHARNSI
ncbi:DUF948 domain-containing protein [Peribacillus cavernae]|uniref:DUF948 domain-containing protein n=1 Tax=Peribacillus cavernae TaxID=1674310 RepID=A0A3S0VF30_9BACI|nr:DUF948 domain-containing protein [Peribacillus cavernae]MDQ0219700.1 uncharacterized protein YoxC [Peribacillus cavernae]RUQ25978.1 DUF948 domain-containing protein [Peribacillus cavernae]